MKKQKKTDPAMAAMIAVLIIGLREILWCNKAKAEPPKSRRPKDLSSVELVNIRYEHLYNSNNRSFYGDIYAAEVVDEMRARGLNIFPSKKIKQ